MNRLLIALALLTGFVVSDAEACNRCGLFGRNCRYYKQTYYAPVYKQAAIVVKQPDLLVVQNNYPQPIAAQGNTVYGYQSAAVAYAVNPAEVLRQAAELSRAATVTAQIGLTGFNATAQTQLQLQASIAEPLIRGQAASQVLTAAGLNRASQVQQQSTAFRLSLEGGQWKVQQEPVAEVNARIEARTGGTTDPPNEPPTQTDPPPVPRPENLNSLLSTKCARCHGLDLTEPKGGVFLDAGHQLDCDVVTKSIRLIRLGKMPKDQPLTPSEIDTVTDELLALELSRTE